MINFKKVLESNLLSMVKLLKFQVYKKNKYLRIIREAFFLGYSIIAKFIFYIKFKNAFNKPPIIIGGCARSGTTLMSAILSAHPHIFVIPHETYVFAYYSRYKSLIPFDVMKIYYYLLKYKINPSCKRFCEKTAKNVRSFNTTLKYFGENIKLINMVRDGRDVILSTAPVNPSKFLVTPERWVNDVKHGLKYEGNPQVLTIKYEDLILNFKETIKKVCDFIGEDCNEHILNWYKYKTLTEHEALFGKIKPLHSKSIGKWKSKKYKNIISVFMKNQEAISLLKHYGYNSKG